MNMSQELHNSSMSCKNAAAAAEFLKQCNAGSFLENSSIKELEVRNRWSPIINFSWQ